MQLLDVNHRLHIRLARVAENLGCPFKPLVTALLHLVRMNITCLGQFDQGPLRLIASTATVALKAGLWFRRDLLLIVFSSLAAIMPPLRGKSTYPPCSDFPSHLQEPKSAVGIVGYNSAVVVKSFVLRPAWTGSNNKQDMYMYLSVKQRFYGVLHETARAAFNNVHISRYTSRGGRAFSIWAW